ncbi:uncharacterized protein [Procambarus clarkii]|uniref:uncharacterized protein n=1 Tax=Procambarus clarkii TaxID=6728 RepID=UPI003743D5CC
MPPLRMKASDTVFGVSRAITTVLRYSTNTTFIRATLARLKVNTPEEAEKRLSRHLWAMLHRHQGADIPPEVAEEISTLPLQEHTNHSRITTELDDSPDNTTTREFAMFNKGNYNDALIFPHEVENLSLDLMDDGTLGATFEGLHQEVPPGDSTSLLVNNSSSRTQPSDSGIQREEIIPHWLQVDSETTREQRVNNEIISQYNNELNIYQDDRRQESSYEDRDFYEDTGDKFLLSSIRDSTFFDSPISPGLGCLEESQFFEDALHDADVHDSGGSGKKIQDDRSSSSRNIIEQALSLLSCTLDREEPRVSQSDLIEAAISGLSENLNESVSQSTHILQHQQHVKSQTSTPPSQNSSQKSRLSRTAPVSQDVSNAINPSQLTTSFHITDEFIPPGDKIVSLGSPQDNQNRDKIQDSTSALHESIGSCRVSNELVNCVTERGLDHTDQTGQVEATSDGDNESVVVVSENLEESSIILSGESECLDISDISDTDSASLGKDLLSSKTDQAKMTSPASRNVPEAGATSEFGDNDGQVQEIQYIKVVSAGERNAPQSVFLYKSSPAVKCNTMTAICNQNLSLQNNVVSQSYREEQVLCDRKLPSNASSKIPGTLVNSPSHQFFPQLPPVNEPRPHDKMASPNERCTQDSPSIRVSISTLSSAANNVLCSPPSSPPPPKRLLLLQSLDIATQAPTCTHTQDSANEQETRLSCEQDSSGSNTNDNGVSRRPHQSHHVVLKQFPEEVSSNLTLHHEDKSYFSSEMSLHLNENGTASAQILSRQNVTNEHNRDGRLSQYSHNNCSGFLQSLHVETIPDLHNDRVSEASCEHTSAGDSTEDDNSESLLEGMTIDPVRTALSYARLLSNCASSCENINVTQEVNEFEDNDINDPSSFLPVSINQNVENTTKSLINLTGNTKDLCKTISSEAMAPKNPIKQTHSLVQDNPFQASSPIGFVSGRQEQLLKNTIMLDNATGEDIAPSSSNTPNNEGQECPAGNQLLILHEYKTGQQLNDLVGQNGISGDHTVSVVRELQDGTSDVTVPHVNSPQLLVHEEGHLQTTAPRDNLPAKVQFFNMFVKPPDGDAPQDNISGTGQEDNELQVVPITDSKQLHVETPEDDLHNRRTSTNKMNDAETPGDLLGTKQVQKGNLTKVALLRNTITQPPVARVALTGDHLTKVPLTELTKQDYGIVNKANDQPADIPLSGDALEATMSVIQLPEIAMAEDELWETNIPEVIIPDDHFDQITVPYSRINESVEKSINVKKPTQEIFIPDVTMQDGQQEVLVIEGTIPPDFTMMEDQGVDDDPSLQLYALPETSTEAMPLFETEASRLTREDTREDTKEVINLESDPTTRKVSADRVIDSFCNGEGSGEVPMLDIDSSDHELSLSLDYDSDDFIW